MNKQSPRTIEIHGRQYETVASRVARFREDHTDWTLQTKIVTLDESQVVIEAQILNPEGRQIANGHAQEFRSASQINKTSYVENCETSAIGRALAALGIGGSEFATANEVQNAIHQQKESPSSTTPVGAAIAAQGPLPAEEMDTLRELAANLVQMVETDGNPTGAHLEIKASNLDHEQKTALWGLLAPNSKTRAALKREAEKERA
jgi:hypothetical protein